MIAGAAGYASSREQVLASADDTVVFRLNPAGQVRGRVLARDGRPVVGARVTATVVDLPWVEPHEVVTDAAGAFALLDLEPASYALAAQKGAFAVRHPTVTRASVEPAGELAMVLDRGATVAGRVLDQLGQAVSGAKLRLLPDRNWENGHRVLATSGPDGTFAIEGTQPGRFALRAERPPHAPAEVPIVVSEKDQEVAVTMPAGAAVAGLVTSETQPVAGAVVTATVSEPTHGPLMGRPWAAVRTGSDGRFRLDGLPAGDLMLSAGHKLGYGAAPALSLAPGDVKEVTVTLGLSASLAGTVRLDDGSPAAGVSVAAGWHFSGGYGIRYTRTRADGGYRIPGIHAGEVTVIATRGRVEGMVITHGLPHQALVSIGPDQARTGVDLVLPRAALRITGVVVGAGGGPRPGVTVALRPAMATAGWRFDMNAKPEEAVSGADGTFTFEGLDPQPYQLSARHPDTPAVELPDIAAGTSGVRVVIPEQATASGRVVGEGDRPVSSFVIRMARADGEGASASQSIHDPAGTFTVPHLAPGRYDLVATTADGRSGRASTTVSAAEDRRDLLVRLGPGAKVKLRVVEHGTGAPIAAARVAANLGRASLVSAETDATGSVELAGLPAGQPLKLLLQSPLARFLYLADNQQFTTSAGGTTLDLGTVKLLRDPGPDRTTPARLGLRLESRAGQVVIAAVDPASPADRAGLEPGQSLLAIDGIDVRGLGPTSAARLVTAAAGPSVSLAITTPGSSRTVVVTRSLATPK
jgi:hypothetical protein